VRKTEAMASQSPILSVTFGNDTAAGLRSGFAQ
jgi:hypothetical protein